MVIGSRLIRALTLNTSFGVVIASREIRTPHFRHQWCAPSPRPGSSRDGIHSTNALQQPNRLPDIVRLQKHFRSVLSQKEGRRCQCWMRSRSNRQRACTGLPSSLSSDCIVLASLVAHAPDGSNKPNAARTFLMAVSACLCIYYLSIVPQ